MIEEVDCPYCAEKINAKAKKCKHCGEILDVTMRELEMLKSHKKDIYVTNNAASSATSAVTAPTFSYSRRTKSAAVLWCLFFGGVGAHKFYLGRTTSGIVYLLLCWTFLPAIASIFETFYLLVMSPEEFDRRFNGA